MFKQCQNFAELHAAYEQAIAAVTSNQSFAQTMADLAADRPVADDDRIPQWDTIKEAMHARWSELSGTPWPVDSTPVIADSRHFEDSDRPDMEQ
jgi:hypothetical protein